MRRASASVALRRMPLFAVGALLLPHVRGPARSNMGELSFAVVALCNGDPSSRCDVVELHAAIRALPDPCVDALEDLLGYCEMLEAERLYRRRMLAEDWRVELVRDAEGRAAALRIIVVHARAAAAC